MAMQDIIADSNKYNDGIAEDEDFSITLFFK